MFFCIFKSFRLKGIRDILTPELFKALYDAGNLQYLLENLNIIFERLDR